MKARSTLTTLFLLLDIATFSNAELIPSDDLWGAIAQSGYKLTLGKDRSAIHEYLSAAITDNQKSSYSEQARRLRDDLSLTLKTASTLSDGEQVMPLMETSLPIHLVAYSSNWGRPLEKFLKNHPRDPMAAILSRDRSVINLLLTQLSNRSPTRSYRGVAPAMGDVPKIPRVCDMAILAIEFHSNCRFHFNASSGKLFHELPPKKQTKIIRQIEKWWSDNKNNSVSAGIRSQLPNADFYGKVWMAKRLSALGKKGEESDREYAVEILRSLVKENWGYTAAYAANALAELDDYSSVDVFYARWLSSLDRPGKIYDSHVAFYLTDYGKRREWELLHKLAQGEIQEGLDAGTARIWPALVNCRKANSSALAIPGLALALTQTKVSGSRYIKDAGSQAFSYADTATEHLQKLTKVDFRYRREGSAQERTTAIRKAQAWWDSEGRRLYTFDSIETQNEKD